MKHVVNIMSHFHIQDIERIEILNHLLIRNVAPSNTLHYVFVLDIMVARI